MKTINTRRTIRKYSDKEVSDELLDRLLTEAARTQTMGNLQLYSVVVTRSMEGKERLAPAHFNQPMVTGAPVVLTICADYNRTSTWCRNRKAERLPTASFVHYETYHDYTPEDINLHYAAKEALEENRRFCEINNKETLAQIFTDIRYTKKDNEAMSEGMMEALKKQGFL